MNVGPYIAVMSAGILVGIAVGALVAPHDDPPPDRQQAQLCFDTGVTFGMVGAFQKAELISPATRLKIQKSCNLERLP